MMRVFAVLALVCLSACTGKSVWAPDDVVARATYRHDGPPRLTLYTMINNKSGAGAHSSLLINGSQRVIWDPAGSFHHDAIPERNDVIIGATPSVVEFYKGYHARQTFRLRVQELDVSPAVAERALKLAMSGGPVPDSMCALRTSAILAEVFPGQIHSTWFPKNLSSQFARLGASEREVYEYDSDDNKPVLSDWVPPGT